MLHKDLVMTLCLAYVTLLELNELDSSLSDTVGPKITSHPIKKLFKAMTTK